MGGGGIRKKILGTISKHDYGLTIEEVANALQINRMTASKYLAILEATGEIVVRNVGKAKLHYPKGRNNQKWLKLGNRKSSSGYDSIGFLLVVFLFVVTITMAITATHADISESPPDDFRISVTKDYPEKIIRLEISGPPLVAFNLTLLNAENKIITPKENITFRTDAEGRYELGIIGFVPGNYSLGVEYGGRRYAKDFEVEYSEEFECNRSFLEYRVENETGMAGLNGTNESMFSGQYVWDICRDFVEANVTKEEIISQTADNRTFAENGTITNETTERPFLEVNQNLTEITENRTFMENLTFANETIENRTFVERILGLSSEKKIFRMDEKPRFMLIPKKPLHAEGNAGKPEDAGNLAVLVYDARNKTADVKADVTKTADGEFEIELSPGRAFRPGMYSIVIKAKEGEETYEEVSEFLWGVVSLNTKKSTYKPGETAEFEMVVLDKNGHSVCNVDASLTVTDPNNGKAYYSTADGTIRPGSECGIYYADYATAIEGNHTINVNALIDGAEVNFSTAFAVMSQYDFDIIRTAQSKIDPIIQDKFDVRIDIESFTDAENFTVSEYVPAEFEIIGTDAEIAEEGGTKILTWNKDLTGGKTYVEYSYSVPHVWPYLYEIGPAEIVYGDKTFYEARPWYVAVDPVQTQPTNPTFASSCSDWTFAEDDASTFAYEACDTGTTRTADGSASGKFNESDASTTKPSPVPQTDYMNVTSGTFTSPANLQSTNVYVYVKPQLASGSYTGTGWKRMVQILDGSNNLVSACYTDASYLTSFSGTWDQVSCSPSLSSSTTYKVRVLVEFVNINKVDVFLINWWVDDVQVNFTYNSYPRWSTPEKNLTTVYRNDYVRFNATWNDDDGLAGYVFSINQGGGWTNSSYTAFSGTSNVSQNVTQITASAETAVQWRFYANDTGNLWNMTDIQQFTIANSLSVRNVSAIPQKAKNATTINITANVTDIFYFPSTVRAQVYYPNGTFWQNLTMANNSEIYYNATLSVNFYPSGSYNVTIWANNTNGDVNSSEKTWFAPFLNLSDEQEIVINGSFADWDGVDVITDNVTDAVGGGVPENEVLITGLNTGGNLSIYSYNSTLGTYVLNRTYDTGYGSPTNLDSSLAGGEAGDVTHDGKNDFIISEFASSSNYYMEVWSYNRTSGEYYRIWTSPVSSGAYWIGDIGDFDNDSFTEFVATNATTINIWGNDTANATGFAIQKSIASGQGWIKAGGDLNGNGVPEIAGAYTSGNVAIWEWNGTDYKLQQSLPAGMATPDDAECADFDGDTADECVLCGSNRTSIVLDYSGGSYSIVYAASQTPGTMNLTQTCSVGDFNHDGRADFFDVSGAGIRVFTYNGTDYKGLWNGSVSPDAVTGVGASNGGDADNDGRDEMIRGANAAYGVIYLYENDTSNAVSFQTTFNWTGATRTQTILIADLDSDGGEGGSNANFDITNVSLANNASYLFARLGVNGSVTLTDGTKYYRMFVSINDSTGNETTPEGESLPFKYDYRVQVNGSRCYVFNYTDYANNISSCLFNYSGGGMEIGVNLTIINLSAGRNANITFETGASSGYDFAPDMNSFLSYDIPGGAPPDNFPTASLGTNPIPSLNDSDGSIVFDLKCSDDIGVSALKLYGNWTGSWVANQTNSTPANNTFWNVTVSGIPEGTWKWGAWCNDTSGQGNWSDSNRTFTVDLTDPTASMGTNPVDYINDSDGSLTFDLKCSDNVGVNTLQLWGNWTGSWVANQTNSTPANDSWWNVTVPGIPEGTWKWGVYCNDSSGRGAWSGSNRTLAVDLTNPQMGSKYINESGSMNAGTIVCLNVSGVSDAFAVDTVWTAVTQSNGSVFNVTMSDTGNCAGSAGDGWYSADVDVGDASGTFFYNTTYVNDSSGRINSNTTVLNLTVSISCSVDFQMTSQLQTGIRFEEQDPGTVNASAVGNGDYNITDSSISGCGTVNVSIMATTDLENETSIIGIGNVTVNSTSPDSQVIHLSTNYQLIRSAVPAGQNNITTLFFWLTTPQGQDPRVYNTTIYIREERE